MADALPLLPLTVDGLTYRAGSRALVDGVTLNIQTQGITVVMGPNGAGKSLFVRLLHGLIRPDSGRIIWNNHGTFDDVRARQAMVFQKPVLLRRSVAANIDFVLKLKGRSDPDRRNQLLEDAGLGKQARQPARRLSGGEQQKLALARALATDPAVLFLDEPSASLDPAATSEIEQIARTARDRGIKIFLVTHDAGQARRLAEDVIFLHQGRLAEHSDAARFFDQPRSPQARQFLRGELVH